MKFVSTASGQKSDNPHTDTDTHRQTDTHTLTHTCRLEAVDWSRVCKASVLLSTLADPYLSSCRCVCQPTCEQGRQRSLLHVCVRVCAWHVFCESACVEAKCSFAPTSFVPLPSRAPHQVTCPVAALRGRLWAPCDCDVRGKRCSCDWRR